jgi:Na+/H+-dicarboxylate symporter
MNIIPKTFIGAFAEGDILQVLLLAILVGLALAALGQGKTLIAGCDKIAHLMFGVIGLIMQAAPIGAFGAMAYTVGHYGLKTLIPLAKLMACVYITSISVRVHRPGRDRLLPRVSAFGSSSSTSRKNCSSCWALRLRSRCCRASW